MLAILNFLNAHNLPFFQPILMILVSKFMVHGLPVCARAMAAIKTMS